MTSAPAAAEPRFASEHAARGFRELEGEVITPGLCTECRACVDVCTADGPEALALDLGRFDFCADRCTGCGLCYAVCPEVPWAGSEFERQFEIQATAIGKERALTSATTKSPAIRSRSADGGVVTSLLWYLLDTNQIDGAILSRGNGPVGSGSFLARTKGEILQASGTRVGRGGTLSGSTEFVVNLDTVAFLRHLHRMDPDSRERLAMVGTPCQTYAIRRMQQLAVAPSRRVTVVLGLFCYEALPLNKVHWQRFEDATGLRVEDIERVQMREDLVLTMRDGRTERIALDTASLLAGPNCLRCADFSNRFADIALGASGSDPGFTTVLARTELGRGVLDGALDAGYIAEWSSVFDSESREDVESRLRTRLVEQTRRKVQLARSDGVKTEKPPRC